MDEQVGEVMPTGIEAKQLAIQNMREIREGLPIEQVVVGEGPSNTLYREARFYVGVVIDGVGIVEADEIEAKEAEKDQRNEQ
jgi:hypothetical protein